MSIANQFFYDQGDIKKWLLSHGIKIYTIEENKNITPDNPSMWLVNVPTNVDLDRSNLDFLPVQFKDVGGNFLCSANRLTSLMGCPQKVDGSFSCSHNKLECLDYAPKEVVGGFYCFNNHLTSLKGAPASLGNSFSCQNNQLISLEYCPEVVAGVFNCANNNIETLEFLPKIVSTKFNCANNPKLGVIQNIVDFEQILEAKKINLERLSLEAVLEHDKIIGELKQPLHPKKILKV